MAEDAPMRSKQLELFGKMHLGMDHVLKKLLLDAPPLPDSLKLQTETQSLSSIWVQVTETFEKRKLMLQRRKEKEKNRHKGQRREEDLVTQKKKKEKRMEKEKTKKKEVQHRSKQKIKSRSSADSPRTIKSSASVKMDVKSVKKKEKKIVTSPRLSKHETKIVPVVKEGEEPNAHDEPILKKLWKIPLCGNVALGTNKCRAVVKWVELDKGKNAATSSELTKQLEKVQPQTALEKEMKPKLSQKRSLESLEDALRVEEKRSKQKVSTGDHKQGHNEPRSYVEEDQVAYEPKEEGEETGSNEGCSDSDDEEFVPELQSNSPPSPVKSQKIENTRPFKRQDQSVEEAKEKETTHQMTSLAAVVAKIRADEVASINETKYLSYEAKEQPVKLGASLKSAIVLDDSEKEGDKDAEEDEDEQQASGKEEEESTETQEQDSSTDDDSGVFDLNEEDVYVVEAILCVKEGRVLLLAGGSRRHKESDLYLVKWEGYNELTWEPEENIPRRLIEMFRGRERAKRACQYQIKVAHERKEVINLTTQAREIIYMIQWINQDLPMWESRTTLPVKTQVWLDKVFGAAPRRNTAIRKL